MDEEKQKRYNIAIDFMRIIAILGVILIHTTTRTLEAGNFQIAQQQFTLFLNQAARFAVPLFFLISGFVLEVNFSLHTSYLSYFKKRVDRTLIPYVFWSFLYYFFVYTRHSDNFILALLNGSASYQLYFIPSLLIFYFLFPLIHKIYRFLENMSILVTLGFVQMILLCIDYYFHAIHLFYPLTIVFLNFYIFILGIFFSHHQQRLTAIIKKWRILFGFVAVLFSGIIFYEGFSLYQKTGDYLYIYSQLRISVFVYTLFFSALLYSIASIIKNAGIIKKVSSLSFFVFFIHVIILETVWTFFSSVISSQVRIWMIHQLWFDVIFFFTVSSISFFIAFMVHKIRKLRILTG